MTRINAFFDNLEAGGMNDSDIASGLLSGDIEKPAWMAFEEDVDHVKVIDSEDGSSSFQMGFAVLSYDA